MNEKPTEDYQELEAINEDLMWRLDEFRERTLELKEQLEKILQDVEGMRELYL